MQSRIDHALAAFAGRVDRVKVSLADRSDKSGNTFEIRVRLVPSGIWIIQESRNANPYMAIEKCRRGNRTDSWPSTGTPQGPAVAHYGRIKTRNHRTVRTGSLTMRAPLYVRVARLRDPEDRIIHSADARGKRQKMLDKTIADSFPASDPPSSLPDPQEDSFKDYGVMRC
jgi:hypothetical protein